ncbi:chitinase [Verticillium dahliae VdLs.17]|uniref:chitinase n=1 Tax=Verticillium dahliae (strain VdLs.17 / ATCC MYA-4575 / FGSC 10137) TaxID=498257 RepID=G2X394_VERDV|nr:chitinase [Verticillium dahliae VdLs.17]EGY23441.1 chitinase [Verticillium dahliae VdLs.17]
MSTKRARSPKVTDSRLELPGEATSAQEKQCRACIDAEVKAIHHRYEMPDTGKAELEDTSQACQTKAQTYRPYRRPSSPGPPAVNLWTKPSLIPHWKSVFGCNSSVHGATVIVRRHQGGQETQSTFPIAWIESGRNAYGCVKQLFLLKKSNRYLKTMLSIGGWTLSANFPVVASTPTGRLAFAQSSVSLMKDWGFDGIDIDWEYPADKKEAENFILLLAAVRQELNAYASQYAPGHHFLLTIASPAGPTHYEKLDLKTIAGIVDTFYLMGYDYSGSWNSYAAHQANLYPNSMNKTTTPFSTDEAITGYLKAGVPASQIALGMPTYGRAFQNTNGLGRPFSGIGGGSWENGVWDYKALPRPGATAGYDDVAMASFSYDVERRELISYDTPRSVRQKISYLKEKGLAGSMFWEASGDRADENSLISMSSELLGPFTGQAQNQLDYPNSQYENIRAGME